MPLYHNEDQLMLKDSVGPFIAEKCVKLLSSGSLPLKETKVGVLGLTLIAFVPTLILAALSWHLIEAPAMKLKRLFANAQVVASNSKFVILKAIKR